MSTIKYKFDSAQQQTCDYCGAKIPAQEDKTIIGMPPPRAPWLGVYHPSCYELFRKEGLEEYLETLREMSPQRKEVI